MYIVVPPFRDNPYVQQVQKLSHKAGGLSMEVNLVINKYWLSKAGGLSLEWSVIGGLSYPDKLN